MIRAGLLVALVLGLDLGTKLAVVSWIPEGTRIHVIPGLNIVHRENSGIVFGYFKGQPELMAVVRYGALAVLPIIFWIIRRIGAQDRLLRITAILVIGAALGNIVQRLALGTVTDFVDVYVGQWHWPAFNVSDSVASVCFSIWILKWKVMSRLLTSDKQGFQKLTV